MLGFSGVYSAQDNTAHGQDGFGMDLEHHLLVVCDGVSSSEDGDGERSAQSFIKKFHSNGEIVQSLGEMIKEEDHACTIVVAQIRDGLLKVCSIGDSRVYKISGNVIERLTRDHNLYADLKPLLDWEGDDDMPDTEEITEYLQHGFPNGLVEAIAKSFFKDPKANIFEETRLKRVLRKIGKEHLKDQCLQEFQHSGQSITFLTQVIRSSPSILFYNLSDSSALNVISVKNHLIAEGDDILLTTDGLHGNFGSKMEMLKLVRPEVKPVRESVERIFTAAKNAHRKKDDMTIVYGRVGKV